jgi:thiazole synthase ThiGH ThiG subunit
MPEHAIDAMAEALARAVRSGREADRGEVVLTPAPASPGSATRFRR